LLHIVEITAVEEDSQASQASVLEHPDVAGRQLERSRHLGDVEPAKNAQCDHFTLIIG
jgi:hypothetical protein